MDTNNKKKSQIRKNMFEDSDLIFWSIHPSSESIPAILGQWWGTRGQFIAGQCFWTVGGSESTQREPVQTQGEHANCTQGPGWNPTCNPLAVRQQWFIPSLFQMASMSFWSCLPGWDKIILAVHVCPTCALDLFLEHRSGMHCWARNLTTVNSIVKSAACRAQCRCILK